MPGMESRAPERTETSSGMADLSPNLVPMIFSMKATPLLDLRVEDLGIGFLVVVIIGADLGGDGEAGGHGQADAAHFSEVGAFATEQRLHGAVAVSFFVAKDIYEFFFCHN